MPSVPFPLVALLAALAAGPAAASAQAQDPGGPAAQAPATQAEPAPATELPAAPAQAAYPTGGSGLPPRTPPPATLRAYWHLFGAFAITVLLIFGYALSVGRRFARLEDEVTRLTRRTE